MSHTEKVYQKEKKLKSYEKGAKIPEKSDVLFFLSYLPPFSDFVLLCLTPPPPLKSDIIYVRSLILHVIAKNRHLCRSKFDSIVTT